MKELDKGEMVLLEFLYSNYPKPISRADINKGIQGVSEDDISRAIAYLSERGYVKQVPLTQGYVPILFGTTAQNFGYRLTADGVDLLSSVHAGSGPSKEQLPQAVLATAEPKQVEEMEVPQVLEKGSQVIDEVEKIRDQTQKFAAEMRAEQEDFQRQFLGRIIEIFGIFISIFTIVIVTVDITTKVSPDYTFLQLLSFSTAMFIPPVIALIVLITLAYFIARR